MKAIKENKEYTVTENEKKRYLNEGFDLYDDNGTLIEYSPKKKIEYNIHVKKIKEKDAEISELKEQLKEKDAELKAVKLDAEQKAEKEKGGKK